MQWLHAMRREEGKDLRVTKKSKVRSRHFISSDSRNSLNGRVYLKGNAMPSNGFRDRQENGTLQQCNFPHRLRKSKEDEIIDQHQDMLLFRFIQRQWYPASDKCEWVEEGCWVEKRSGQLEPPDLKRQLSSTKKKLHEAVKRVNALLFGKIWT